MNSQLSEEKLNEILPSLKQLAEFISAGEILDRRALHDIASSVGMDGQEWALTELELWGQILVKCKGNSKEAVETELQSRGIPRASAELACYLAKPKPMKVEPQFLDFGTMKIGERAEPRTLTVSGESVIKTNQGSRITVTLLHSGPAKTLVRVKLADGDPGEIVKDEITLRGSTGELRVSVTAEWKPKLLSWCPVHGNTVGKKCLFFDKNALRYECFYGKEIYPYSDKRVCEYNDTHK